MISVNCCKNTIRLNFSREFVRERELISVCSCVCLPLARLRVETVSFGSRVRIQSDLSREFLCFNKRGLLIIRVCIFACVCVETRIEYALIYWWLIAAWSRCTTSIFNQYSWERCRIIQSIYQSIHLYHAVVHLINKDEQADSDNLVSKTKMSC